MARGLSTHPNPSLKKGGASASAKILLYFIQN